jgi:glucose/mannose transport system permease protein
MTAHRPNPLFRNLNSKIAALPMMLIVLCVFVGGTIWTVASSFTNIKTLPIFTPQEFYDNWVGFAQYARLWRTPRWITAITNLAIYGTLYTAFAFVIGFFIAVLMDQKIRLEGVFRTIYLYPFALSLIVTGHVWAWILNPAYGLEGSLRKLGWESFSFDWLTNREMSIYCVVIAGLWQGTGLVMALMLAGLRGIDDEIWRAARIDGIPKWRTYVQIVLPMLKPVLVTTFVIVASGAVRTYDLVVALTQGGPGLSSQLPTLYVYETMFVGALAQGTAASSIMLLATAVILIPWIWVEFVKKRTA